jgi:hypothetical protein
MRRVLAAVLTGLLAISLTACGGSDDGTVPATPANLASRTFRFADGAAFGRAGAGVSLTFGAFVENASSFVLTSGDFAAGSVIIGSCTFDVVLGGFSLGQGPLFGGQIRIDPCTVDAADGHLIAVNAVTGASSVSDPSPLPSPSFPCCPDFFVQGQLIVGFQSGTTQSRVNEIAANLGASVIEKVGSPDFDTYLTGIPAGQELAFIPLFKAFPEVRHAEPNFIVRAQSGSRLLPRVAREKFLHGVAWRSAAEQHRANRAGDRHVDTFLGGERLDRARGMHAFGDVAEPLENRR